jgi:DNA-binding NarL/FixJ family response regulator
MKSTETKTSGPVFTPREEEVLELLHQGLSNKAIARKLNISHYTVRDHISALMEKTGTLNRVHLALQVSLQRF